MDLEFNVNTLMPLQMRMQLARKLFAQALNQSFSGYEIGGPENVLSSPRTNIYAVMHDRKCNINPEALGCINGMTNAIEWISENSAVRTFFSALMANFFLIWYNNPSEYSELCNQIGLAVSLHSPHESASSITSVASIPQEITDRWLHREEIRDQLIANKWLLMYYLFFLWADVEKVMQNDEIYQRTIEKRSHIHRGPTARQATADFG